jgi:iron complex transport system ATP-binding protein
VSAAPSPADPLLVEARGLTAAYGSSPALRGLDASIRAGEVAAVLGENGSGKSTFLKVVARVLRRPAARCGSPAVRSSPCRAGRRRSASRTSRRASTSSSRSAAATSCSGARARTRPGFSADGPEDLRLADEAMRACDVAQLADRDASALSGGERRRVFLARRLAQQAECWLLDEPTAGLDPRHRLDFLETLARVHRERRTTVLLVTHEIAVAAELATWVLLLKDGRAIAEGPTAEVLTTGAAGRGVRRRVPAKRSALGGQLPAVRTGGHLISRSVRTY